MLLQPCIGSGIDVHAPDIPETGAAAEVPEGFSIFARACFPPMARTKRSSSLDSQRDLLTVHDGGSKLLVARLRLQNETLLPVDSLQSLDGFNSEGADNSTPEKNSPRSSVFSSSEEDGDNQPVVSDSLWEHFLAEFDWRQPRETFMYKNERVVCISKSFMAS